MLQMTRGEEGVRSRSIRRGFGFGFDCAVPLSCNLGAPPVNHELPALCAQCFAYTAKSPVLVCVLSSPLPSAPALLSPLRKLHWALCSASAVSLGVL